MVVVVVGAGDLPIRPIPSLLLPCRHAKSPLRERPYTVLQSNQCLAAISARAHVHRCVLGGGGGGSYQASGTLVMGFLAGAAAL